MIHKTAINDCQIIALGKIHNQAGNITVIEREDNMPFKTQRIFYIYDIPGGEGRGAHAHKECHQLLIAASGSFNVKLDDGLINKIVTLNRPYYGLHIPPGIWAQEFDFSSGSICLVLTSHKYSETDYIRDYSEYIQYKNQ